MARWASNVDSYVEGAKRTSLRKRSERLTIAGMIEGVNYKITEINNPEFVSLEHDSNPAQVGESMCIGYDFKATKNCMRGWEKLMLYVWRTQKGGANIVRYFANIAELEAALVGIKFELDLDFARRELKKHRDKIAKLEADYGITE